MPKSGTRCGKGGDGGAIVAIALGGRKVYAAPMADDPACGTVDRALTWALAQGDMGMVGMIRSVSARMPMIY